MRDLLMSDISLDNFDYAILRILQKTIRLRTEKFLKNWSIVRFRAKTYISYGRKGNNFKNCAILNPLKFGEKLRLLLKSALAKTAL